MIANANIQTQCRLQHIICRAKQEQREGRKRNTYLGHRHLATKIATFCFYSPSNYCDDRKVNTCTMTFSIISCLCTKWMHCNMIWAWCQRKRKGTYWYSRTNNCLAGCICSLSRRELLLSHFLLSFPASPRWGKNESLSQQLVSVIPSIAQDSTGDQLPDRCALTT